MKAGAIGVDGGASRPVGQAAVDPVQRFEPSHVHALFAFERWRQAAGPEVQEFGDPGRKVFREALADVSAELIGWLDGWRNPPKERS